MPPGPEMLSHPPRPPLSPALCTLQYTRAGDPEMFGESMSQPKEHVKKTGNKH